MFTDRECSICKNEYGNSSKAEPKVLQCGHSYCAACIRTIIRSNPNCPLCSRKIFLPEPSSFEVLLVVNKDLMMALDIPIVEERDSVTETDEYGRQFKMSEECRLTKKDNEFLGALPELPDMVFDEPLWNDEIFPERRCCDCRDYSDLALSAIDKVIYIFSALAAFIVFSLFICFIVAFLNKDDLLSEARSVSVCLFAAFVSYAIRSPFFLLLFKIFCETLAEIIIIVLAITFLYGNGISIWAIVVIRMQHDKEKTLLYYILACSVAYHALIWVFIIILAIWNKLESYENSILILFIFI
eukprot:TRINITY_DN3216_c0_g1_i4.p1 TRINITY_DN3216_c0_g1~~TRINITY_DN3216_c0_g1_i4.p1  ORF type:complete len:299 (-),score=-5.54 TRINITY_DN3216_c0_g1_i4:107-1003(-)